MSQTIPSQINYKPVEESAQCQYRQKKLFLNNVTGSSVSIAASTTALLEFKIPNNTVFNLAQSYLEYQVVVPAQAAGIAGWIAEDCFEIATNAFFGGVSGNDLCNLNYCNRFTRVMSKVKTKFNDFITNDVNSQLYPCNTAAGNGAVATANPIGIGTTSTNYIEPRYLRSSTGGTLGQALAFTVTRQFPLKNIVSTIFAVDKDLYSTTDLYIRFTVGPGNQFIFGSVTNANPTSTPTAMTGNVTIQAIDLILAVETNQLIIDSVISKVRTSGLKVQIPYTTAFRNSSTGTVANVQIPMTQQYGHKLRRMIHTVWDPTESANTCLDCSNSASAAAYKITSYNTSLDSQQLQDAPLLTAAAADPLVNQNDWLYNKKYCAGSVIQNRLMYQLNWFHMDQFYEQNHNSAVLEENLDEGLPMTQPRTWAIAATTVGNATHYNFATFSRTVLFDNNGVQFI